MSEALEAMERKFEDGEFYVDEYVSEWWQLVKNGDVPPPDLAHLYTFPHALGEGRGCRALVTIQFEAYNVAPDPALAVKAEEAQREAEGAWRAYVEGQKHRAHLKKIADECAAKGAREKGPG